MNFKIIVKDKLNEHGRISIFKSFYLMEERTGNCFPNKSTDYMVAPVTKDKYNQEIVDGKVRTFDCLDEAIAYADSL